MRDIYRLTTIGIFIITLGLLAKGVLAVSVTNDISISANGKNATKSVSMETKVNGKVVPESVVNKSDKGSDTLEIQKKIAVDKTGVVQKNEEKIEILEKQDVKDENGKPLIERENVNIEKTEVADGNLLATLWKVILNFFQRIFV